MVDAILGTSTRKRNELAETDLKRKVEEQVMEQSRFFINPKHRRRDTKWVQSTEETDQIFLTYKVVEDVQESVYRLIYEEAIDKSCNETYRCFLTTQAAVTTTPTPRPGSRTRFGESNTFGNLRIDNSLTSFEGNFLRSHLRQTHKPSRKRKASALHSEQGGVSVDDDIVCDPTDRYNCSFP